MWKFLDKLRRMPEGKRQSFAIRYSALIGLAIVVPWFIIRTMAHSENEKPVSLLDSPFSFVRESAAGIIGITQGKWKELSNGMKPEVYVKADDAAKNKQ